MVGLLVVGCVLVTSASLLCIHRLQSNENADNEQDYIIFDEADLPEWEEDVWMDDNEQSRHDLVLAFTRTHGKCKQQLPIVGLPDKALYNIH